MAAAFKSSIAGLAVESIILRFSSNLEKARWDKHGRLGTHNCGAM